MSDTVITTQTQVITADATNIQIITAGTQGPSGQGVPTGGTTNQFLKKNTGTNFDTGWGNPNSAQTRFIVLTGAGGWPSTTNGCNSNALTETTTNKQNIYVLGFAQSVKKYAEWTVAMPDDWDGGALKAQFFWTTTASSGNVVWGIQAASYGDNNALDAAWGTAVTVNDGVNGVSIMNISAPTGNMTASGTPAGGKLLQLRAYRDGTSGSDTMAAVANLVAVKLQYTTA